MDDEKILNCPNCDHSYTYPAWQVEECCPFCKYPDGWDVKRLPEDLSAGTNYDE